jgi:carbonic anhydrase
MMFKLIQAKSVEEIEFARALFTEYAASLNYSLCFESFDKELASLPGEYAPPSGRLVLAMYRGGAVACVALRKIDDASCEMKRLYVQPDFRREGIGLMLVEAIIDEARSIGYKKIRLETTPGMEAAVALYKFLEFEEIPPYVSDPIPGAIYMELGL